MIPIVKDHKKRTFFLSLFIIYIAISMIFLAVTILIQSDANRLKRAEVNISEQSILTSEQYFINYKINRLTSDLRFIYDTLSLNYPDNGDFSRVEALWLSYSNNRKVYDQIRYIDSQGNEVVRVDYTQDGSVLISKENLQNKKDRYYFQQTINLAKDQIYISPIDLNVENGAIELPINPVLRLAMPYFDARGVKAGIVILNYSAADILTQIKSLTSGSYGDVYFLNNEGYWLYNSKDPYTEWAFSYNPDSTVKFPNYYAKEWGLISAGGSGSIETSNGYFSFAAIPITALHETDESGGMLTCEIGSWYIVSLIPSHSKAQVYPSSSLVDLADASIRQYYLFYIILFAFSVVLAVFVSLSQSKSKQVKFFSEFDAMTNAYNRRSGIEKLTYLYKNISKYDCSVCVCFLDVNGLKEVNDTLGHEAGDELITTVASIIRSQIRSVDFLVRLGGDEFLIVYSGIDEVLAEQAWARIVSEFERINGNENRNYLISVSHGIESLACGGGQQLDSVLNQADAKMYEEKRRIKSEVKIIRQK